jgi:hypothetical protein
MFLPFSLTETASIWTEKLLQILSTFFLFKLNPHIMQSISSPSIELNIHDIFSITMSPNDPPCHCGFIREKQLKSTLGLGNRKTLLAKTNSSWGRLMFEN